MALLNRFNFIMWSYQPPQPEHLVNLPGGIPNGRCSAAVLLVPNEESTFYINAPDGLDLAGATIRLVDEKFQTVKANIGYLTQIITPVTSKPQQYGVIIAPPGLKEGYYRMAINPGTDYYSNRLWYKPSKYDTISAQFSFRNLTDLVDVPYTFPDMAAFRQNLRLKVVASISEADTQASEYTNVFTARKRTVSVQTNDHFKFTTFQIDAIGREGFKAMLNHSDIKVNNRRMSLKSGYASDSDSPYLANGSFELWDTDFAMVRDC